LEGGACAGDARAGAQSSVRPTTGARSATGTRWKMPNWWTTCSPP
jgi:hypothetical protein